VEVYGDKGTLVLGSENQKDYIHGFRVKGSRPGLPLTEIEIPNRLTFPKNYADGRISAFIRVIEQWVQGIDRGEAMSFDKPLRVYAPSLREGVYSQLLMDLAHQSNTTKSWVDVPDLEAFLSHNMNSF
jgi:hypothetical protein